MKLVYSSGKLGIYHKNSPNFQLMSFRGQKGYIHKK